MTVYILIAFLTSFLLMSLIVAKPKPVAKPQDCCFQHCFGYLKPSFTCKQKPDDLQITLLPWHDIGSNMAKLQFGAGLSKWKQNAKY